MIILDFKMTSFNYKPTSTITELKNSELTD